MGEEAHYPSDMTSFWALPVRRVIVAVLFAAAVLAAWWDQIWPATLIVLSLLGISAISPRRCRYESAERSDYVAVIHWSFYRVWFAAWAAAIACALSRSHILTGVALLLGQSALAAILPFLEFRLLELKIGSRDRHLAAVASRGFGGKIEFLVEPHTEGILMAAEDEYWCHVYKLGAGGKATLPGDFTWVGFWSLGVRHVSSSSDPRHERQLEQYFADFDCTLPHGPAGDTEVNAVQRQGFMKHAMLGFDRHSQPRACDS